MKWFTCTPVAFKGDHTFFCRDTGLYCKGLQALGIESRAVVPLPGYAEDWPDILRTDYANLEDPAWWRSHQVDGVILYAWSKARYTPIAKAIHESGATLVLYLDTGGVIYPWQEWRATTRMMLRRTRLLHPSRWRLPFVKAMITAHLAILNYPRRRKHLNYGTHIGIPSPHGIENHRKVPFLLTEKSKKALFLMPCPIAEYHRYDGTPKERRIMAIGRWDDEEQKRTHYLMQAIDIVTQRDATLRIDLFGCASNAMKQWHQTLDSKRQSQVTIHGVVPNTEIAAFYQRSQICLCASLYEGTHNVSAEALCNGASVVVANTPFLQVVHWYTTQQSGRIAQHDTPTSFAQAVLDEFAAWDNNERDPHAIANVWGEQFHVTSTLRKILNKRER